VRAVGTPLERFKEDGLRAFKACRMASQLEFDIEKDTFDAIPKALPVARLVSMERIRDEFMKMLMHSPKPSKGIELMRQMGLLEIFMPELLEWEKYIQAKRENAANLNNALKKAEFFYTKKGCKIGILTFSGVGGMKYLYSKGCDIAILVNPDTKKISIGSINKNLSQLCVKLNEIEKGWGGRERIISSPFNGTNISEKFIKKICYKIF
jgi:hypothetical protein